MTPEERMRLLRNESEWTFTLPRRASPFPARRARSPWLVSAATIAAVAVVVTVVFSVFGLGIRSARPVAPPVLPTQSATPSPTPAPTSSPGAQQPAQVFGGDCSTLYTEAELSTVTGAPMTLYRASSVTADWGGELLFQLEQVGGLSCSWGVEQAGGGFDSNKPEVNFFIAPVAAVGSLAKEATCGPPYSEGMYGKGMCGIEHETGGMRFSGGVLAATKAEGLALSQAVIARLNERAAAFPFAPAAAVAGAWSNPVDCVAVAARLDVSAVFGANATFEQYTFGGAFAGPPLGREITNTSETTSCRATSVAGKKVTETYRFGVMGGGAWVRNALAGSTPTDIPGIGAGFVLGEVLYVFSGPNLITLRFDQLAANTSGNFAAAAPQLHAVITALDAM